MSEVATETTSTETAAPDLSGISDADLDAALRTSETGPASTEPEGETAASAPAKAADDAPAEGVGKTAKDSLVNHGALHEERMRRKNVEAELASVKQQAGEALRQLREEAIRLAAQTQPRQQVPDEAVDPVGAIFHGQKQLKDELGALRQQLNQGVEQDREVKAVQTVVGAAQASEAQFRTQSPDYDKAVSFLQAQRRQEFATLGVSEAEAQRRIVAEALQVSDYALQRGESPAETMYRLSIARGYVPESSKMAMQQEGQRAAKPSGGASAASPRVGIEALLAMDADEFDKVAGDPKAWKKLAGG